MRVVIASTSVPYIDGGGRLIVKWTADALRAQGHDVEEFYIPFPQGPRPTLSAMVGLRAMPFAGSCDRLIAIRWPAHVIRHENKATWFIHHYRMVFDLWNSPHRNVPGNAEGRAFRDALLRIDNQSFAESQQVFTNSLVVRDRVRKYNHIEPEVLFPPLGGDLSRFRTDSYGDFIFYPSRITPIKRQLLAVQAMRHTASAVRLVIAGKPEVSWYEDQLRDFVREHQLEDKVDLRFGWLDENVKTDLLAKCLAVAYLPASEDSYGYPSLEASHSGKAIVTTTDSGGPLEFVRDDVEGLITEPDPRELAAAFDRLYEDRADAERMGQLSGARREQLGISWSHALPRLLGEGA